MTEKRGKIRSAMQEPEQSLEDTALSWLDDESGEALLNRPYTRWGIPNRTVTMINGPPRTADWRDQVRSASTAQLRVSSTAASEAELPDADAADAKPQRWSARRPPRSALKKERSRSNIEYSLLASLTSGPKARISFETRGGSEGTSRPGTRGSAGTGSRPGSRGSRGSRPSSRGSDVVLIDSQATPPPLERSVSGKLRAAMFANELFASSGKAFRMFARSFKGDSARVKAVLDAEALQDFEAHEAAARQAVHDDPHGGTLHPRLVTRYPDRGRDLVNRMLLAQTREELQAVKDELALDVRPGGGADGGDGRPRKLPTAWTDEVLAEIQAVGSSAQGAMGLRPERGDLAAPIEWDKFDCEEVALENRVQQIKQLWDCAAPPALTLEDFRNTEKLPDAAIAQMILDWASPEFRATCRRGGLPDDVDEIIELESRSTLVGLWMQMVEMRKWGGVKTTRGLLSWGANDYGQLGHGDKEPRPLARPLMPFVRTHVEQVACGAYHTLISLGPRGLMACGLNRRGQLGTGTCESTNVPALLLPFTPVGVREEMDIGKCSPARQLMIGNLNSFATEREVRLQFMTYYGFSGSLFRWFDRSEVLHAKPGRPACLIHFENEMAAAQAMRETQGQYSKFSFDGMMVSYFHPHYAGTDTRAKLTSHTEEYMLRPGVFVKRVMCGFDHSMVLLTDGTVIGWGNNRFGQVGTPKIDGLDPEYVLNMEGLPERDANLTELKPKALPLFLEEPPSGLKPRVTQMAVGGNHTLLKMQDGRVMACGRNDWGQLGLGVHAPDQVFGVVDVLLMFKKEVRDVACGASSSFCILHDQSGYGQEGGCVGAVWAFGRNDFRQLGIFAKGAQGAVKEPTLVDALANKSVISIAANEHTIAVCEQGEIICFGLNDKGQLGIGDRRKTTKPEAPEWNKQTKRLGAMAGAFHSLYLQKMPTASGHCLWDDLMYVAGYNKHGELGLGHFTEAVNGRAVGTTTPALLPFFHNREIVHFAAGWYHTLAVCRQVETAKKAPSGEVAGEQEVVGRLEVVAFGYNKHGQLGLGHSEDMPQAMKVPLLNFTATTPPQVRRIACGGSCTFFLTQDGQVLAAGCNSRGQLGLGSFRGRARTPVVVKALDFPVDDIVCGFDHCFAVLFPTAVAGARLWSFGANAYGQLGLGTTEDMCVPTPVELDPALDGLAKIACGGNHTLLVSGGKLFSCGRSVPPCPARGKPARPGALARRSLILRGGRNDMGQCGSKDKERKRFAPVPLPTAVLKIACGASHSMLVREPMFLVGFGRNDMGQLGLPGEKPPPIVKQPLTIMEKQKLQHHRIVQLACGSEHTLLVLSDGSIIGTGCNLNGQLGLGHTKNQRTFAQLPIDGRRGKVYAGAFHTLIRYSGEHKRKDPSPPGLISSAFCSIS